MEEENKLQVKKLLTILFIVLYFSFIIFIIFSAGKTTFLGGLYQKSCGDYASVEGGEIKIISNKDIMCSITNPLIIIGDLVCEILSWLPILFIFGAIISIGLLYFIGSFLFKLILRIPSKTIIIFIILFILLVPGIIVLSLITQNPCQNFQGNELSYCLKGAYASYDEYYMQKVLHNLNQVDPDYVIKQGRGNVAYDALDNIEEGCKKIMFSERKKECYEHRDFFAEKIDSSK